MPLDQLDWAKWVLFFLTAIAEQAKENGGKATAVLDLHERMKVMMPGIVATHYSVQVLDALFDRPVFRTTDFVTQTGISKRTAMRVLAALEESGVLSSIHQARGRIAAVLAFGELLAITEGRPVV
ncbi:MAG: hypothetical protein WD118_01150 [Phycisphaeraceae bacterium]